MGEAKFTPGPWEVDFENCHAGQVATCHGHGEGYYEVWSKSWMEHGIDQKANAHLIARAPTMYSVIEWALAAFSPDTPEHAAVLEAMHGELAKARGE